MSEFIMPELQNDYVRANLLTNNTSGSIMLQVQDTFADESILPSVVQFKDNESLFYNNVVTTDPSNENIINGYIANGIISNTILAPKAPIGYIKGIGNSTHNLSIKNNVLTKQNSITKFDGLELFYSISLTNKLEILVYKGLERFFYSIDSGFTIIPIPTEGMLYPQEITSVAIQNSISATVLGKLKIWVGTLREGLLSYTLGATTWVSETDKEVIGTVLYPKMFQFRDTLIHQIIDVNNNEVVEYVATNYSPVYILGILNSPIEAGLPLIIHVKNTVIDLNSITHSVFRTFYKYLSINYISYIPNNYQTYTKKTISHISTWIGIEFPYSDELIDVLKSVPFTLSPANTVFSSSSILTTIITTDSTHNYLVRLLKISITNDINNGATPRTLTLDTSLDIYSTFNDLKSNQITGLSTFNKDIFITTRTKIYRYIDKQQSWSVWIDANGNSNNLNFKIDTAYTFTSTSAISYISGLRGFGVIQDTSKINTYIGIVNTDLGHITIPFISTSNDFLSPIKNTKKLRNDLFGTQVKDFQVISEINQAFSCGLEIEPPIKYIFSNVYDSPVRCSSYIPQLISNLPSNISYFYSQIFYKNYTISDIATLPYFINRFNDYNISIVNNDQEYINSNNISTVNVFRNLTAAFSYLDTNNNYNWLNSTSIKNYVSISSKYNLLYFMLQTIQNIPIVNATLSSNLRIPFIPDIDFENMSIYVPPGPDPVIVHQPVAVSRVDIGSDETYNVMATGNSNLHYVWSITNQSGIWHSIGTDSNSITIQAQDYNQHIKVIVSDLAGEITSNSILCLAGNDITPPVEDPVIVTQPSRTPQVNVGADETYTVVATGNSTLHYAWTITNQAGDIWESVGSDSSSITIQAQTYDQYIKVVVSDLAGQVTSNTVLCFAGASGPKNWIVETFAGTLHSTGIHEGSGAGVRLNYPAGIGIAPDGYMYVLENYSMRRINQFGGSTLYIQGNSTANTNTDGPVDTATIYAGENGLKIGPDGNVYFSAANMIRKVDLTTNIVSTLTTIPSGNPQDLAFDSLGNMYFTSKDVDSNYNLYKLTSDNILSIVCALLSDAYQNYKGIAIDTADNIYISEYSQKTIYTVAAGSDTYTELVNDYQLIHPVGLYYQEIDNSLLIVGASNYVAQYNITTATLSCVIGIYDFNTHYQNQGNVILVDNGDGVDHGVGFDNPLYITKGWGSEFYISDYNAKLIKALYYDTYTVNGSAQIGPETIVVDQLITDAFVVGDSSGYRDNGGYLDKLYLISLTSGQQVRISPISLFNIQVNFDIFDSNGTWLDHGYLWNNETNQPYQDFTAPADDIYTIALFAYNPAFLPPYPFTFRITNNAGE